MEQVSTATEQKLLQALMQFRRLGWHQQTIGGCKPSEIRVLFCIQKCTSSDLVTVKVSEISRHLHVTSPTVTQVLRGLETHELIERHSDAQDRRIVGVRLTDKGELVVQQAHDAFTNAMNGLVAYLGETQSDQLADLLCKVHDYFQQRMGDTPHPQWNGDEDA
jgi:DNA-binding MarR family transcriptional regulator